VQRQASGDRPYAPRGAALIGAQTYAAAFITVGGAPIVPDSPMPLMPSGSVLHGH